MTMVIGRASVAPVLADPHARATQVTQLVLGETARVSRTSGRWHQVALTECDSAGWVHGGYLVEVSAGEATAWHSRAAWCAGALVQVGAERRWLPLRARVALADGEVQLPGGESGRVLQGEVRPLARVHQESRLSPPEEWARTHFAGAPYLWGGVTPGGVDCSGLVQTTWLARGVQMPRDSADQATMGIEVPREEMRAGDLVFSHGAQGGDITHVAFAGPDATLIHSSLAAGGVAVEAWLPGQPAAPVMERLATIRRIPEASGSFPA